MTFVLTPRSHYNTITEPHARFHFSLMEGLSIEFPSHMIESIIDCYHDMAKCDKLIFSLAITCIPICTSPSLPFLISMSWVPLARSLFCRVLCSLLQSSHGWSLLMQPQLILQPLALDLLPHLPLLPHLRPLSPLLIS